MAPAWRRTSKAVTPRLRNNSRLRSGKRKGSGRKTHAWLRASTTWPGSITLRVSTRRLGSTSFQDAFCPHCSHGTCTVPSASSRAKSVPSRGWTCWVPHCSQQRKQAGMEGEPSWVLKVRTVSARHRRRGYPPACSPARNLPGSPGSGRHLRTPTGCPHPRTFASAPPRRWSHR